MSEFKELRSFILTKLIIVAIICVISSFTMPLLIGKEAKMIYILIPLLSIAIPQKFYSLIFSIKHSILFGWLFKKEEEADKEKSHSKMIMTTIITIHLITGFILSLFWDINSTRLMTIYLFVGIFWGIVFSYLFKNNYFDIREEENGQ